MPSYYGISRQQSTFSVPMPLIVPHLQSQGLLRDLNFVVCIVGSRKLLKEFQNNPWTVLAPNLTIYGFDADPEACDLANDEIAAQNLNYTEIHLPRAISGDVGESLLYVTKAVHCSSLYPPNTPLTDRLRGYREGLELDFAVEIETTTLDELLNNQEISQVDFLQVDVQGADLDVLTGAKSLIRGGVLGVEVEVEFSPLYQDQPLFSDIDVFLRDYDFSLFDLNMQDPWCRQSRHNSPIFSNKRAGQLLWADALYLRDIITYDPHHPLHSPQTLLKQACIADILEFTDYSVELLEFITLAYGDDTQYNFAPQILEILSQAFDQYDMDTLMKIPILERLKSFLD